MQVILLYLFCLRMSYSQKRFTLLRDMLSVFGQLGQQSEGHRLARLVVGLHAGVQEIRGRIEQPAVLAPGGFEMALVLLLSENDLRFQNSPDET